MKRPLSLLEVAIGMVLTGVLLTALFSTFRQLVQTNASVQKIRHERHWTYVTHLRLAQIFETTYEATMKENILTLQFNNGIDPDPTFCDQIQAKLYVEDKTLMLNLLSNNESRIEVLYDKVKEASIHFYDPKEKTWVDTWKEKELFPAITLTLNQETFTFSLPKAQHKVLYP